MLACTAVATAYAVSCTQPSLSTHTSLLPVLLHMCVAEMMASPLALAIAYTTSSASASAKLSPEELLEGWERYCG